MCAFSSSETAKASALTSRISTCVNSVWCEAGSNFLLSCRENQLSSAFGRSVSRLCWTSIDTSVENPLSTNTKADCQGYTFRVSPESCTLLQGGFRRVSQM